MNCEHGVHGYCHKCAAKSGDVPRSYHGDDRSWIQTFSGRQFWPLDPRPEDVYIVDIAHALALTCRFSGHCREFYSVAQHSVIGSRQLEGELAKWFLLHDAAEAYMFDATRPVKREIPDAAIEEHIMRVIAIRFDLGWPQPPEIKEIDNRMLMTERRDLLAPPPRPWTVLAEPFPATITPMSWRVTEDAFSRRFRELFLGV